MMKKRKWKAFCIVLSVFMALFASTGASLAADGPPEFPRGNEVAITVFNYNIHHGVGEDGQLNLNRIADLIRQSGADVVALQEVDRHWSARSEFQDQPAILAELLGMHYVYGANLDRDPLEEGQPRRQYGTAILSKYPIIQSHNYYLSSFGAEQRGLLETTINVKGNPIHVYNTHLGLTVQQRQAQVNEILDITGAKSGTKMIAGDFNAKPNSAEIQAMASVYTDGFAGSSGDYTFPTSNPSSRIDYIFTTANVTLEDRQVLTGVIASDHLPITGKLVLNREAPYENGLGQSE